MPAKSDTPFFKEQAKYRQAWARTEYANISPAERYKSLISFEPPGTLIDLGCGTGRVGCALQNEGYDVTLLDIVDLGLCPMAKKLPFIESTLWAPDWARDFPGGDPKADSLVSARPGGMVMVDKKRWDYSICCDVMEHIPSEYVMLVLDRIARHCDEMFFTICNRADHFGETIGHTLHMTVQTFEWWLARLKDIGEVVDARHLIDDSIYTVKSRYA